ncbi:MAG: ferritin family protein [Phycisphaerae bacterium]
MVARRSRFIYTPGVSDAYDDKVAALSPEKAMAIGMYGESVASYRYRVLAEKVSNESLRAVFLEMADEENGHHQILQEIMDREYPGSDFVLTPEDKDLIIVGPRMLDLSDGASIDRALKMIHDSERLTGRFYGAWRTHTQVDSLKPMLLEMSEECFEHAAKLLELDTAAE